MRACRGERERVEEERSESSNSRRPCWIPKARREPPVGALVAPDREPPLGTLAAPPACSASRTLAPRSASAVSPSPSPRHGRERAAGKQGAAAVVQERRRRWSSSAGPGSVLCACPHPGRPPRRRWAPPRPHGLPERSRSRSWRSWMRRPPARAPSASRPPPSVRVGVSIPRVRSAGAGARCSYQHGTTGIATGLTPEQAAHSIVEGLFDRFYKV
jgi:hypothetical protein